MYQKHPNFDSPDDDTILWRYMDLAKFLSILEKEALFFTRADKLGDPYEGAPSDINVKPWPMPHSSSEIFEVFDELSIHKKKFLYNTSRRYFLINCWCESEDEIPALWKQYTQENYAIAVKTDFHSLKNCFRNRENVFIGRIEYIDYSTTFIEERDPFAPFLHKRKNFEVEREVRALINAWPTGSSFIDTSQDVCEVGEYYYVDYTTLIKEIVISPEAEDWFVKLVESLISRYCLKVPVNKSKLIDLPAIRR